MSDFTEMMRAFDSGESVTAEKLLPRVYQELRKLAAACLAKESPGHAREPTSLVHDAYLRLVSGEAESQWQNEAHFFGAAAIAIRRVLVDSARRRKRLKHGAGATRHEFHEDLHGALPLPAEDLISLDEALGHLSGVNPKAAELVQLVYFSGLTRCQAAELLGISPRSADRLWAYAKAWLRRAVRDGDQNS